MQAKDLKIGNGFKLKGQRKLRFINKIIKLKETDNILPEHRGKLLIIHSGCKQLILDPETNIIT